MLQTLRLHNFKTFLNTELHFSRRHLLIGKNASGKTNLAAAMQFLAATASRGLNCAAERIPGGLAEICNWQMKSDEFELSCDCRLEFEGQDCDYRYDLALSRQLPSVPQPSGEAQLRVVRERLSISGAGFDDVALLKNDGREVTMADEDTVRMARGPREVKTPAPSGATMLSKLYETKTNRRAILFRKYLAGWAYYAISPLAIRRGWFDLPSPRNWWLDPTGEQLSNTLFQVKNIDERRYRRVIEHAAIVEPALRAILFVPVPDKAPIPFVELEGCPRASWNGLSDGALRALALSLIVELAAASSPPERPTPCLAIMEEPENGIFPGQLRKLFDLFEECAPSAQFIFTSHSPYFIDMFDNNRDCVTVLTRAKDRSELAKPRPPEPIDGRDRLTLSMEYASELFQ